MKPTLPQGMRDFGAESVRKRNFILNTIRTVFELYGFQPLETPAIENLDTLLGKYGEEGDKLIFKILNNGLDRPEKRDRALKDFEKVLEGKPVKSITERALKYDLTIPFARYVAMNYGQLQMPFKRYQMQPVWRADRPQKGRYREFYQCDADVVGTNSSWNELEFANLYKDVFTPLKIPIEIRINDRKILAALMEKIGKPEMLLPITASIDKLDKAGPDKVKNELTAHGLSTGQVTIIEKFLKASGNNSERMNSVSEIIGGNKGIEEIKNLIDRFSDSKDCNILFDQTLARGLNYYTGIIFEVKATGVEIGSIGGGGRYDDLTGLFGVPNVPGVGISFGLDRIYDVMEELNLFPEKVETGTKVLFLNLGEKESRTAYKLLQQLREKNISGELYPDMAKMDKQLKFADRKKIPFAIIIGEKELKANSALVKDLRSGNQQEIKQEKIVSFIFT